jgi:hypothetical protein
LVASDAPIGAVETIAWLKNKSWASHGVELQEMLGALKGVAVDVDSPVCKDHRRIWNGLQSCGKGRGSKELSPGEQVVRCSPGIARSTYGEAKACDWWVDSGQGKDAALSCHMSIDVGHDSSKLDVDLITRGGSTFMNNVEAVF